MKKVLLFLVTLFLMGGLTLSAKTEKVHATFENPSNTNTTWDAETRTFTWSTTYYNQLRNIGLPNGDITKYKKLVVDCTIKSGDQFRILFYKGGSNLTLYAQDGVNEFIIKDALEAVAPNDYNEYLLACDEICLSGNNGKAPGEAVINDVYLETYDDEGQKVYATFESPSNTNTTWDAETKTFTWSTTYYNQLRNIGLPNGDISGYKKLVVDCTIKSGDQFRILFYKGGSNLTLYAQDGVNEFIIKDALEAVAPNDYNEYLLACDEICLSGNNGKAPGEAVINSVYLETYPENEVVDIPEIQYEEDPGKPEGDYLDFTEEFPDLKPRIGLGEDSHPIVLGNGDVVVGARSKNVIADLSNYSKLIMKTSPNLKLVVYMNHEIDAKQNPGEYTPEEEGKYVCMEVQADENGLIEVDLTEFDKQDLNCVCLPWDNNNKGTVWYMLLAKPLDPVVVAKNDLTKKINEAKSYSSYAKTEASWNVLTAAIEAAEQEVKKETATIESLEAAKDDIDDAIQGLTLQDGYTDLTKDMFMTHQEFGDDEGTVNTGCAYELNSSTSMPYGLSTVNWLNYADLSEYDKLIVIVTPGGGQPRFCFNRTKDEGQDTPDGTDSYMIDIPNKAWGTQAYETVNDEKTIFTIDLAKMVEEQGMAFLHSMKSVNGNIVVTDMLLYKEPVIEETDVTITMPEKYDDRTYSDEVALDFSTAEGLTAYIIVDVVDGVTIMKEVTKVPANTGLYLVGKAGATYTVSVIKDFQSDEFKDNLLKSTINGVQKTEDGKTNYMLGVTSAGRGFHMLKKSGSYEQTKNKAYLSYAADEANAPERLFIGDGEANRIANINVEKANGAWYTINGVKLNGVPTQKGMYIRNGKKIMIK